MQPRDQTTLQDAGDKHEVLPKAQLARDKSESAGAQSHHCTRKFNKSSTYSGTDGKAIAEDQQAAGSVENNDTAFLDAKKEDGVDYTHATGPRVIRPKIGSVPGQIGGRCIPYNATYGKQWWWP